MKKYTLSKWLLKPKHTVVRAARAMRMTRQSVYDMKKSNRNVKVFLRDGKWVFEETKELGSE